MGVKKTFLLWPALAVIALDQMTKHWIATRFPLHETQPLISGFFNLVHVRNRGMAFGIMNRPGADWGFILLLAATLGAVALLLFWFYRLNPEEKRMPYPLSLVLGGAIGNLLDRIRIGEVIDFLDFYLGPYHWPAFNVADSAITVGTIWLAASLLFHPGSKEKKA
ncbi:MAG: lipoprotein signal peptidase [Deltaproteobacteria bacterium]|nr:lipoprotein signal peptidase [Deltaproteobacteria bacterium]